MKFKKTATTLVAIMALAAANTAFAAIFCLPITDEGGGLVQMSVTSISDGGLIAVPTFELTGAAVSASIGDCTIGSLSCTVTAQGAPGGGPQLVTFLIRDLDDPDGRECPVTRADGLPVELNKYSVE